MKEEAKDFESAFQERLREMKEKEKEEDEFDGMMIGGGEIIEPDDSINCKMKNIYLVCSMNNYEKERRNIRNERKINPNYILVNEKFILDSYYFMTGLEVDNLINIEYSEYSPEYCYKLGNEFFK